MENLAKTRERLCLNTEPSCENDYTQIMQMRCDSFNAEDGDLSGSNCDKCKNKGLIAAIVNGCECMRECDCMVIRRSLQRVEQSGLRDMVDACTFDSFMVSEDWQQKMKSMAERFCRDSSGAWLFLSGQPGCGKTHLSIATTNKLMNTGKSALYALWRDKAVALKAIVNDSAYSDTMDELKQVEILCLDDFFKTEQGKQPTAADINLAFELINYRYNNPKLITIISTEKSMDEILDIDEATGSRIFQRAGGFCLTIGNDRAKNYRLRKHGA